MVPEPAACECDTPSPASEVRMFSLPTLHPSKQSAEHTQPASTGSPGRTESCQSPAALKFWGPRRAEKAVVAALLHDTLDDTSVTLGELQLTFGPEVAACVEHVSRLSELNQMLRRHLRQQAGLRSFVF